MVLAPYYLIWARDARFCKDISAIWVTFAIFVFGTTYFSIATPVCIYFGININCVSTYLSC